MNTLLAAILLMPMSVATASAAPAVYHFQQSGIGNTMVRGSFVGADFGGSGMIDSRNGDVSQFQFDWNSSGGTSYRSFLGQYSFEVLFKLPAAGITDASNAVNIVGLFLEPKAGRNLKPCLTGAVCGAMYALTGSGTTSRTIATPEPGALVLFGLGAVMLGMRRRV